MRASQAGVKGPECVADEGGVFVTAPVIIARPLSATLNVI